MCRWGAATSTTGGLADAANRAGVEWLIVEQDETDGEAFEAVADSLARLRSLVEVPA